MEENLKNLVVADLFAGSLSIFGAANAADGCGPGCHNAPYGGCVVDGWSTGEVVWTSALPELGPVPRAETAKSGARATGPVSRSEGRRRP
jgi:hypothetical protein